MNRTPVFLFLTVAVAGCGQAAPSAPGRSPSEDSPARAAELQPATSRPVATTVPPEQSSPTVEPPDIATPRVSRTASSDPEPVYRPDDDRPSHDDRLLEQAGIHRYASKRLVLYSNVEPALAEPLPALVDALYEAWVDYFGELPAARDGSDFQITGYLMGDTEPFLAAGLLPENLPTFDHGRHRRREFWLHDQSTPYYRAHLLLHEATHCFMTALPASDGPIWYMEGMAEHFATHRIEADDRPRFRILPASPDETPGFSRINRIQEAIAEGRFKTIDEVLALGPDDFNGERGYEWSWAACHFFDSHPRYRHRFRALADPRLRKTFSQELHRLFSADAGSVRRDWALFSHALCYGYEVEQSVLEPRPGEPLREGDAARLAVAANRGWQSSGVSVVAGKHYEIAADGTFTLADEPKPWLSDAGGISFDYAGGQPVGLLLAAVLEDASSSASDPADGLLSPIVVGRRATLTAAATGTLYLRINDGWDRLSDNRGNLEVTIRRKESGGESPESRN